VFGHPELLIADGSVHVTNGRVTPVHTFADRNTTRFAKDLPVT
jgi:hypothetical protein